MNYNLVNENFRENYGENLLRARGVTNIEHFLQPDSSCLQDSSDLDNINEAASLLHWAVEEAKVNIITITDCDTDGYCSCSMLYQYIKQISPEAHIDVLFHSGKQHGLSDKIDEILDSETNYGLCLIADAGSNDFEYIERLGENGIKTLVIDHHILETEVSKYCVIINNQASRNYKNKDLCGGGMVYQFLKYYDDKYGYYYANNYIDLAALAEIGDMMDMKELENRYIVTKGLSNIRNKFFLDIIDRQAYSMNGKVNPMTVAFYIVPLINAMIRVGTQEEKERLFWAFVDGRKMIPSHKRGAAGTEEFASLESIRECTNAKARQGRLLDQITAQIDQKIIENDLLRHKILFIELTDEDNFPPELNGLVAMKCAAKYKKPTIVARCNKQGEIKGSARNVANSKIPNLKTFFLNTGYFEWALGHEGAHGLCLKESKLQDFLEYTDEELENIDFGEGVYDVNFVRYAAEPDIKDIIFDLHRYENVWGQGNQEPLVYIGDLNITKQDIQILGKDKNTVKITKNGIAYMKFHAKEFIEDLEKYEQIKLNIIGKPNVNEWMGNLTPQIFIEDYEVLDDTYGF